MCDPNTYHIYIKSGQSKTQEHKTLLHEILHCIAIENEIKIPHNSIYKLEDAILRFLKLNKVI